MSYQNILAALNATDRNGKSRARCPAHGSKGLTLSIAEAKNGNTLLHCHAGCTSQEIMNAIGLPIAELFADDSSYTPKPNNKDLLYWRSLILIAEEDATHRKLNKDERALYLEAKRRVRAA